MSEQKSVGGFHLGNGLAVLRKDPHAMVDPSQPHHACMELQGQQKSTLCYTCKNTVLSPAS